MAQSLIRNKVGEKTYNIYVPADDVNAQTFADAVLEGTYAVLAETSVAGSDVVTEAEDVTIFYEEDATKKRNYLRFLAKTTVDEEQIINALVGKTYNGIKADKVVIISMRTVTF
ncbi:hypothetical protein [Sulfurimonas sp. NWX367]|uniref:hypothetical protein n=1 Tax=Sulfurimonas sp. NWX367 TaxID=2925413 RepID=UPI003204C29C